MHERTARAIEALHRATLRTITVSWHITTAAVAIRKRRWSISSSLDNRPPTLGQYGSGQSFHHRLRSPQDPAGHSRTCPTRTHPANRPGCALTATKGLGSPGSGSIHPGMELCQQVGETPQLFPVLCWAAAVFSCGGGSSRRPVSWGSNSSIWPGVCKTPPSSWKPTTGHTFPAGRVRPLPESTLEQGLPSTIPSSTAPWPSSSGHDPGVLASPLQPGSCGFVVIRTRRWSESHGGTNASRRPSHPCKPRGCFRSCCLRSSVPPGESRAQERAEAAHRPSSRAGISNWLGHGTILRGWALVEQGQREAGIVQIRQGLANKKPEGQSCRPIFLRCWPRPMGK